MNKEEYLNKLKNELSYLTQEELDKELDFYKKYFESEKKKNNAIENSITSLGKPKELAKSIYNKRGIDASKFRKNILNNIMVSFSDIINAFKNKKNDKKKMIMDIIFIILIIILIKLPFTLVRDIGYEYINTLTPGSMFDTIWTISLLMLYTITAICSFVVLTKNFQKKYVI